MIVIPSGQCHSSALLTVVLTQEQTLLNRMLAPMRAIVEHPFRVLKCQFGYTKVRYRGLYN